MKTKGFVHLVLIGFEKDFAIQTVITSIFHIFENATMGVALLTKEAPPDFSNVNYQIKVGAPAPFRKQWC